MNNAVKRHDNSKIRSHFDTDGNRHAYNTCTVPHEILLRSMVENGVAFMDLEFVLRRAAFAAAVWGCLCFAVQQQPHDDPSRDNRHICCEGALPVEFAQEPKRIVVQNREHVFAKPIAPFIVDGQVANLNRVVDNVYNQSQKPVNKIFPTARLTFKTSR